MEHKIKTISTIIEKSPKEKIEDYLKKAEEGDVESLFNLGFIYENGQNTQQNNKLAAQYYIKAADLGHPESSKRVGLMYLKG